MKQTAARAVVRNSAGLIAKTNPQDVDVRFAEPPTNEVQPVEIVHGPNANPVIRAVVDRDTLHAGLDAKQRQFSTAPVGVCGLGE